MAVIYKATNKINGKAYIGFAVDFESRKRKHKNKTKETDIQYFHNALKKHGFENFEWTILQDNATLDDEIRLIEEHQTFWEQGKGYNLTKGGEGSLGRIVSDETKEKHRKNCIERFSDEGHRKDISKKTKDGMKRWWESLSDLQKEEWKEKCKKRPDGWKPRTGFTYSHSDEAKQKIGNAHRGKIVSPETREKMRNRKNRAFGSKNSMAKEENRQKVSLSKVGRKRVYQPDGSFKYLFPEETVGV